MKLKSYFRRIKFPPRIGEKERVRGQIAKAISDYLDNETPAVTSEEILEVLYALKNKPYDKLDQAGLFQRYLGNNNHSLNELGIRRGRVGRLAEKHLRKKGLEKKVGVGICRECAQNAGSKSNKEYGNLGNKSLFYKDYKRLAEYFSPRLKKVQVKYKFSIKPLGKVSR